MKKIKENTQSIYQDSIMTFDDAFAELMLGKKIRRKEWEHLTHMRLIDRVVKTYRGEYTNFHSNCNVITSNGWLILNGDGKNMSFIEALTELKNKKFLTHIEWLENKIDKFIFVDNDQIATCSAVEFVFMPTYKCFCATDWEVMK